MFSNKLFTAALLAVAVSAQQAEQEESMADKYPEWSKLMTKYYPAYSWEALEVETSSGWTKTLYHITGSSTAPSFKATRQPVLLVNGGMTTSWMWLDTLYNIDDTKQEYAGKWEKTLLDAIEDDDVTILPLLKKFRENGEKRWTRLNEFWKAEKIVDLELAEANLEKLVAEAEAKAAETAEAATQDQGEQEQAEPVKKMITDEEAAECAGQTLDDSIKLYLMSVADIGEQSNLNKMQQPSKALPISLFDYGFDVWVDGNRGTPGNDENEDLDSTSAEYWAWDMREMALEDQTAQIDAVLAKSDYDKLAYVGFSLGTRQMLYLMGMAGENDAAASAVTKVEKFLALGPCPYGVQIPGKDETEVRQTTSELWNQLRDNAPDALDIETPGVAENICFGDPTCLAAMKNTPGLGVMSKQTFMSALISSGEQKMFKTFAADYAPDKVPTNAIDFSTVSGPEVFFFSAKQDAECPYETNVELAGQLSTFQKHYSYTCADHMYFPSNSLQADTLHKDIVIALGAKTLAASALAAIASIALF